MLTYKPGDYVLTKAGKLYRIVDSYIHNTEALYDIRGMEPGKNGTHKIMCLSNKSIKLFGMVIPEEKMGKLVNLFYR
jgi:hypothetical protein